MNNDKTTLDDDRYAPKTTIDDAIEETPLNADLINSSTTLDASETTLDLSQTSIGNDFNSEQTSIDSDRLAQIDLTPLASFLDYQIISQLPVAGAEADVYLIKKRNTDEERILKLYRYGIKPNQRISDKTIELSSKYPEHLIGIDAIDQDEKSGRWYEIQEYARLGSLKGFKIDKNDNAKIFRVIEEIADILDLLHNNQIIHRDLKPPNVLVRSDDPLDLVLTDFGISSIIDEDMTKKMTTKSGTRIYFAPESFSGIIGKEVDWWALGMIVYELLCDKHPFENIPEAIVMHSLITKDIELDKTINEPYRTLIEGLLTRDPKKRWAYSEVKLYLKGERNIPVYRERAQKQNLKSYKINDVEYESIGEVLAFASTDKKAWETVKTHLMRGYLKLWLARLDRLNEAQKIDLCVTKHLDNKRFGGDLALAEAFYSFTEQPQFVFMGRLITLRNVAIFCKQETNDDKDILEAICDGTLLTAHNAFLKATRKIDRDSANGFDDRALLDSGELTGDNKNGKLDEFILNILLSPEYLGVSDEKDYAKSAERLLSAYDLLTNKDEYLLPVDFYENIISVLKFHCGHWKLRLLKKEDLTEYLPKEIRDKVVDTPLSVYIEGVRLYYDLKTAGKLFTQEEIRQTIQNYTKKRNYCYFPDDLSILSKPPTIQNCVIWFQACKTFNAIKKAGFLTLEFARALDNYSFAYGTKLPYMKNMQMFSLAIALENDAKLYNAIKNGKKAFWAKDLFRLSEPNFKLELEKTITKQEFQEAFKDYFEPLFLINALENHSSSASEKLYQQFKLCAENKISLFIYAKYGKEAMKNKEGVKNLAANKSFIVDISDYLYVSRFLKDDYARRNYKKLLSLISLIERPQRRREIQATVNREQLRAYLNNLRNLKTKWIAEDVKIINELLDALDTKTTIFAITILAILPILFNVLPRGSDSRFVFIAVFLVASLFISIRSFKKEGNVYEKHIRRITEAANII
ncbi:MAG: protein kinase [Helicobacteraceae bacterium]|jgi:serine/threonine protein kinase|nr:protein kinase [Helicobacteraceae bacterium]